MSKRHIWTSQEDNLLRELVENQKILKWVEIASKMNSPSQTLQRSVTPFRCSYINKLSKQLSEAPWSPHQDSILIEMHREYGRRWTLIAQKLQGRAENSIKNHFYSRLRKSLRELNKVIQNELFSQFRTLEPTFLSKLIEISWQKFEDNSKWDELQIEEAFQIIQQLFWGISANGTVPHEIAPIRDLLGRCCHLGGTTRLSQLSSQPLIRKAEAIKEPEANIIDFSALSFFQQICCFMIPYM